MNRFEQKSMSLGRKLIYLLPILAFVILFVLFLRGIGSVGESTLSKQQESLVLLSPVWRKPLVLTLENIQLMRML